MFVERVMNGQDFPSRVFPGTHCFRKDNESALPTRQNFIMSGASVAPSHPFKDVSLDHCVCSTLSTVLVGGRRAADAQAAGMLRQSTEATGGKAWGMPRSP